jgi:ribosomal protein L37E
VGRQNGASIGPQRDLRDEDGERKKLEHDGVCRRCGRSALAELCRSCSKHPSAPLVRSDRVAQLPRALADESRVRTVEEVSVERATLEATDVKAEEVQDVTTKTEKLRCGIGGCDFETERAQALGAHKAYAHRPGAPATPRASKVVHRDVKPGKVLEAPAVDFAARDAQVLDAILALAELEAPLRARVLAYATKRWPS